MQQFPDLDVDLWLSVLQFVHQPGERFAREILSKHKTNNIGLVTVYGADRTR